MLRALAWFGLSFDGIARQSQNHARHAAALDKLATLGMLYPCKCSRAHLRLHGVRAADGGWLYPNTCRTQARLTATQWRSCPLPLRVQLPDNVIAPVDLGGLDLAQNLAASMGDPVVRRRDGAVAYQLAVVVDDAAQNVTDVVRGVDIAASTATQVALQQRLDLPTPRYRHHLLLIEPHGDKLAKMHGSIDVTTLQRHMDGATLCGFLAFIAGLRPSAAPCTPLSLLHDFDWDRVRRTPCVLQWDGHRLIQT